MIAAPRVTGADESHMQRNKSNVSKCHVNTEFLTVHAKASFGNSNSGRCWRLGYVDRFGQRIACPTIAIGQRKGQYSLRSAC